MTPEDLSEPVDVDLAVVERLAAEGMRRLRDRALARRLADKIDATQAVGAPVSITLERLPGGLVAIGYGGTELWRGPYSEVRRRLDA